MHKSKRNHQISTKNNSKIGRASLGGSSQTPSVDTPRHESRDEISRSVESSDFDDASRQHSQNSKVNDLFYYLGSMSPVRLESHTSFIKKQTSPRKFFLEETPDVVSNILGSRNQTKSSLKTLMEADAKSRARRRRQQEEGYCGSRFVPLQLEGHSYDIYCNNEDETNFMRLMAKFVTKEPELNDLGLAMVKQQIQDRGQHGERDNVERRMMATWEQSYSPPTTEQLLSALPHVPANSYPYLKKKCLKTTSRSLRSRFTRSNCPTPPPFPCGPNHCFGPYCVPCNQPAQDEECSSSRHSKKISDNATV